MKKISIKNHISDFIMLLSFLAMAIYMNIFAKSLIQLNTFGLADFKYNLIWLSFSLSWISLFFLLLYLIPKKKRIWAYFGLNIFWNILFVSQICYVQQMGKFMIFSDLFLAGEGLQYIKSVLVNLNPGMIFVTFFSCICMGCAFLIHKKNIEEDTPKKWTFFILIFCCIFFRLFGYSYLGKGTDAYSWQENYNAKNIYTNFTNPNTSMVLCGFYEYNFRTIYKYIFNMFTLDKPALKAGIDKYNSIYGLDFIENEYTGLLKDKNVIYIMMESIDNWIIDEETMPTLKRLRETGLNFTNRYSPFFNGGQTINSEFACNTGLYAISDKAAIYDIEDIDYSYSLANMLKKNHYKVNSFHANTGTFYNRFKFHKRLGYEHHYSLLDMQREGLLNKNINYFADSNMALEKRIMDLIAPNERFFSFITTYSAHLEYSIKNKVYRSIKHPIDATKYNDEEYVYRTLAYDTDEFLRLLLDNLKEAGILEDTILVLVSDHYVYGYSDSDYIAMKKNVQNDRKELQNTPFVIWASELEGKDIDTIIDTADILPTLLNLLGIQYDANKYMGTDVFSEAHDDFVWFADGSYIKSKDCTLSNKAILTKVNYNIYKNKSILLTNYYGK